MGSARQGVPCVYRVFAAQRRSASISVAQPFIDGCRDFNRDAESVSAADPNTKTA
jgi:hypothetical protein